MGRIEHWLLDRGRTSTLSDLRPSPEPPHHTTKVTNVPIYGTWPGHPAGCPGPAYRSHSPTGSAGRRPCPCRPRGRPGSCVAACRATSRPGLPCSSRPGFASLDHAPPWPKPSSAGPSPRGCDQGGPHRSGRQRVAYLVSLRNTPPTSRISHDS